MTTKENLMNSLMGDGGTTIVPLSEDEDLFGGIPVVSSNIDSSKPGSSTIDTVPVSTSSIPPPQEASSAGVAGTSTSSLLASSGLLGIGNGPTVLIDNSLASGTGGGLFDEIDKEAEAKAAAELEAKRARDAAMAEAQRAAAAMEEEAQRARDEAQRAANSAQEEAERIRRQQVQDQMQSIHLGGPSSPPNMTHGGGIPQPPVPYYNPSMYPPQQQFQHTQQFPPQGQYNMHSSIQQNNYQQVVPSIQQQQQPNLPYQQQDIQTPMVQGANAPLYHDPNNMQHQHPNQSTPRYYQPSMIGSPTAGMYNGFGPGINNVNSQQYPPQLRNTPTIIQPTRPMAVAPGFYSRVLVTEPLLLQSSSGGLFSIGQPPHWSYQITTELNNNVQQQTGLGQGVWMVRRRFRHVVALEDRLRDDCPGAILPPRPEKHATRAIEEVGTHQSAEFAMQRAVELQNYLNLLIHHPIAQQSVVLRLFLAFQDDLGMEWPEVSSNAFTRLASASVGAAVKVSESTAATKLPWQDSGNGMMDDFGEDNAELMALQNAESIRIGAVLQAVPKLEGAATLLREQAEQTGTVGMELGRLAKDLELTDRELGLPFEILSAGMLRAGRRSKRLTLELSAALQSYSNQYKLCKYERMAFSDRRAAIIRRQKERGRADNRAAHLLMHQRQQQHLAASQQYYGNNNMDRLAQDAAMMDNFAIDVNQECEEIGRRLKQEVNRVAWNRKIEWNASVKVIASAMKEAVTERVAIWETIRENFSTSFPEYKTSDKTNVPVNQPIPSGNIPASSVTQGY